MTATGPSIYILALEPSGDHLGARLMQALKSETADTVGFAGVGGPAMAEAGLRPLFDPADLAILGIFEVLPKAGLVLRRVREVLDDIERVAPDVLVTIDSWGFTGRIHKALAKKQSPVKRIRYVAPQVWAWRPGRAKQLAGWIDHLLTLFPFEPPLFEQHGLSATWVGHPVTEEPFSGNAHRFRQEHDVADEATLLSVLPGSRKAEVDSLMPVFGDVIERLAQDLGSLVVAIPTVSSVEIEVRDWAKSLPVPSYVVTGVEGRDDAFAASQAAVAASGTVTLELARAGLPHLIAYKVNPLSAFAFRRLTKTRFVNLVNVLEGEEVIPECLQERCTADQVALEAQTLLDDQSKRGAQVAAFEDAMSQLLPSGRKPSAAAADVILELVRRSA